MKYYKITSKTMYEDCLKTLESQGYLWSSGDLPTARFEYFPTRFGDHLYLRVSRDKTISYGLELPQGVFEFEVSIWEVQNSKRPSIFKGKK